MHAVLDFEHLYRKAGLLKSLEQTCAISDRSIESARTSETKLSNLIAGNQHQTNNYPNLSAVEEITVAGNWTGSPT